jgi:hypothetical protein
LPDFGEYRGLRRAVERRILLGSYDKLPISCGVCNQQVVGSNPTAGSSELWISDFGLRTESSRSDFAAAQAHAHNAEYSIAFL